MERKIGEVFQYEGKTYQVVESIRCDGCAFNRSAKCSTIREPLGSCDPIRRKDRINVVFKEINNMENNQLTINIPKGMEIDLEKSDLTKGIVKFKKKDITYEDILQAYSTDFGRIRVPNHCIDKILAISQLMNIAKYYNKNWKPNWNNPEESKYYIYYNYLKDEYGVNSTTRANWGNIYFRFYDDARTVINNPNFRNILDVVYKN